jgi:hypothetical protein
MVIPRLTPWAGFWALLLPSLRHGGTSRSFGRAGIEDEDEDEEEEDKMTAIIKQARQKHLCG